jgi:DNA-binding transcriptional MerR regulator
MKLRQAGFEDENYASLAAIAQDVNSWCKENRVIPKNGQAAEKLTVRNLRFYRVQGLLDAPLKGRQYGRRHFLQLTVLRALQAQGLPLNQIRELMYSKSDAELHELLRQVRSQLEATPTALSGFRPFESLEVLGLSDDFAMLCRRRSRPTREQLEAIIKILHPEPAAGEPF